MNKDIKYIKTTILVIKGLFSLFALAGFVISILTITWLFEGKDAHSLNKSLLTFGVILALYPSLVFILGQVKKFTKKYELTTRVINEVRFIVRKTHLWASIAAILIIIGHAIYYIDKAVIGYENEMHHGVLIRKIINVDFAWVTGLLAISTMIFLIVSNIVLKTNKQKQWISKYRIFHICFSIFSAILIIVHIAVV